MSEHGRGGLGRVSRAHDLDLGRDVAIKELISRGPINEVRFLREALITARLEHPGIVPVHEAGRWPDGTPFYAMKLVAGRPLRDLLLEHKTVEKRIGLLHHVIAVADAIAYAHGRNIIHRDLKPANVIVGDFGETVVIDWGLAKDLTAPEDSTRSDGSSPSARDDGLTSAGSVLGTPAYMSPEQARGEPVDQRTDVFAIGVMLWELCTPQKLPPEYSGQRRRILRKSGIDPDLITIVLKALAPDPTYRYPHAGALATDLKAFKVGARIAARHYSLFATLAHWTRRHRTPATAIAIAVITVAAGGTLYIRDISRERDLAEAAKVTADQANAATTAALAEQTLGHAEVLLSSDPTAAIDLLRTYKGNDRFQLNLLRAQAEGRGVARLRATPHTDAVYWLSNLSGESIASLSADGSIAMVDANGTSATVVRGSPIEKNAWAFSETRQLLAYPCAENELCLMRFERGLPVVEGRIPCTEHDSLAISPDSQRLASISRSDGLTIWSIAAAERPVRTTHYNINGFSVGFLDNNTVVAVDNDVVTILHPSHQPTLIKAHEINNIVEFTQLHLIAIGTLGGIATLIRDDERRGQPTVQQIRLCESPLYAMHFSSKREAFAYSCKDGRIGLWYMNTAIRVPLATIEGSAFELALSKDERYLAIGGTAGILSIADLDTKMISSYHGHHSRISTISSFRTSQAFATADINGNIRVWEPPASLARVAYSAPARLFDVVFLANSKILVTTGTDSSMHFVKGDDSRSIPGHNPDNLFLELSSDGTHLASFGSRENIELWDGVEHRRMQVISAQGFEVVQLKYISSNEIMYANRHGDLFRWSPKLGNVSQAAFKEAISTFVLMSSGTAIVELRDCSLWRVAPGSAPIELPHQHIKEHLMQLSKDNRWLATSNDVGDVMVYDVNEWRPVLSFHDAGAVHHVAISPTNDTIAIAMKTGKIHLGQLTLRHGVPDWGEPQWTHLEARPRFLAFSPSGDLLMITGADGVILFYSPLRGHWLYLPTGIGGLTVLHSTLDGRAAATVDSSGRLTTLDLDAVRHALDIDTHN